MQKDAPHKGHADPTRDSLDRRHESDVRGEHRYPDAEQTDAEVAARRERDELKRRLEHRD